MISIGKLRNADYYEREVVDGAEDYYVGSGEAPGRWVGSLAAELGLDGNVDGDQLRALFELRHPFTDEALLSTRATKPGFDVTISAPKSVSVLWALGDAETSATVVDSLWSAVDDTRRYLEANACSVRRGHAGVDVEDGAGFVGAAFLHRTSRLADPGLHVHLLVINATHDADGRWTALDGRAVYRERYTADAVFQASLRHALASDAGYLFAEPDRHGVAEIAGVPAGVRRAFSQRRIVIEAEMARHGVTTAEGARIATLDTRPPKGEAIEEDELRRRWAQRARQLEFSIDDVPTMRRDPRVVADAGRHRPARHRVRRLLHPRRHRPQCRDRRHSGSDPRPDRGQGRRVPVVRPGGSSWWKAGSGRRPRSSIWSGRQSRRPSPAGAVCPRWSTPPRSTPPSPPDPRSATSSGR